MNRKLILILFTMMMCAFFMGCAGATAETVPESTQLVPIYGNRIKEGTYAIDVSSSSSMFRIVDAQLTVKDGKMSAELTLSGVGYMKLYMGTGEEALADTDDKCIYYVENAEGKYTYEVPVEALDKEINCAAWSIKRERWYDRVLVFQSARIPEEALVEQPADGRYTVAVTLSGGSGRATVESPTALTIKDGAMMAVIIWSSPYYDFMLVDGIYYYPVNTEGNSTFKIPVSRLDGDIAISAETTAMSEPHVIDYTLHLDSSSLKATCEDQTVMIIIIMAGVVLVTIVIAVVVMRHKCKRKIGNES